MKTAGHKARRGRRRNPTPHAIGDNSLSQGWRRQMILNRARLLRPKNPADREAEA